MTVRIAFPVALNWWFRCFSWRLLPVLRAGASCSLLSRGVVSVTFAHRQLQRKILGTFTFVFVTFLLRAVFSTMLALARALQNEGDTACGFGSCDSQCHNVYTLMFLWILYTPEFQMLVVFVASPLSLLVALWGMTDVRALELMAANRERIGTMRETMLRGQV